MLRISNRLRGVLIVLVASTLAITTMSTVSQAAGPIFAIPSPHHDAGTVDEGVIVAHTFAVKNQGTEELRILLVKPG
jgi:hypothetical protein